jgi:hypothetical protein
MKPATFLLVFLAVAGHAFALPAPFLEKHCLDCHDADAKKGGLDLTALGEDFTNPAVFARWVKVHDLLKAGEMPPPDRKDQPPANERDSAVKNLAGRLNGADQQRQREAGRVPLRRLNRQEYENTIRDLFSLPGLKVKEMLPEDGRYDGFDKAAAALDLSAVQLRKYMETADAVLDAAIVRQGKPMLWQHRFRRIGGLSQFGECSFPIIGGKADVETIAEIWRVREDGRNMPLQEREPRLRMMDSLGIITHARPSYIPEVENFSPFHNGFYRIRTRLWSFQYDHKKGGELLPAERMQTFALTADGRVISYLDAPSLAPKEHEVVAWLNAGETLELNPANLWGNYHRPTNYVGPGVAVDFVNVEGPLHEEWPPASHRRLFGRLPIAELPFEREREYPRHPGPPNRKPGFRPNHVDGTEFQKNQPVWTAASPRPAEDAERLLKDFLPRAFRRPVPNEEVAVYVTIARDRLAAGDFFETAMRTAYRTALCSPDFVFLQEPTGTRSPTDRMALDSYAIASRLSYYLWNSMPDQTLIDLATKNQLGGKTLADQIDRMLADPKSDRFVADFLDQWLELREIDFTSPDVKIYPEFRPDLRDAMVAETRAYFREMLDRDLGVKHVIDSDFLTINQRLAEHYGITGVEGGAIRQVPKPAESPRGGFLTQAAILKVTANGTSTSPVLRGAWVMNRILGQPPSPPPPGTPAVDPDVRGATTIREQLDKHRSDTSCAACHKVMDPPGFALENFDVIGSWRDRYRFAGEKVEEGTQRQGADPDRARFLGVLPQQWEHVLNNVRIGLPVDASGATADGQAFQDIHDYKRLLLTQEEAIARALVERLILYATGAPVSFSDRTQVDRILEKSRESGYGLRTLVREVAMNATLFNRK